MIITITSKHHTNSNQGLLDLLESLDNAQALIWLMLYNLKSIDVTWKRSSFQLIGNIPVNNIMTFILCLSLCFDCLLVLRRSQPLMEHNDFKEK